MRELSTDDCYPRLFGVKYGDDLLEPTRARLDDVAAAAGLKPIYGLELRRMAKPSKSVFARQA